MTLNRAVLLLSPLRAARSLLPPIDQKWQYPSLSCVDKFSTVRRRQRRRMSSSAQNSGPSAAIPRAAVAVTVRSSHHHHKQLDDDDANNAAKYLLIQRKNPPDAGKWAFPGGKIDLGEEALVAGQRELLEETNLVATDCLWYPHPFMTTDAIHANDNGGFAFHYLIAHCFAQIKPCDTLPLIAASDDALDAKWWTITEIEAQLQTKNSVSNFVLDVIHRAESLYVKDNLVQK